MNGSWWRKAVVLLCAILLCTGLFFAWTSFNVSSQMLRTVTEENTNSVNLWITDTESRLNTLYEHVYELLVSIYNNTELRTGTPIMDINTKRKIVDMMNDKLFVSADADAFFVLDTENDFYLFSAKGGLSGMEVLNMKNYFRENAGEKVMTLRDSHWNMLSIGEKNYFCKNIQLGKYIVGAISNLSYFNPELKFSILGQDAAFLLLKEDTFTMLTGDPQMVSSLSSTEENYGLDGHRSTVTARFPMLNADVILSANPTLVQKGNHVLPALLLADSALCFVLVLLLLMLLRRKVAFPTRKLIEANRALAQGNMDYRLDAASVGSAEFYALFDSFNEMASQITRLRIEAYDLRLQEEANKLTMLRAQIKPHSFLNAITTISNMTYICKPAEIRAYITVFAKFIRYMLNVTSPWITVKEEINHIRNYLKMQDARFPGSIQFQVDCEEDTLMSEIPFLILYTLVENSIKHAMTLYETLEIRIRCTRVENASFRGICLVEEDSGDGFGEDAAAKLLSNDAPFAKEHLGLSNVRYTLNLVYHRDDLLHLSNCKEGGAHVELWIPDKEEKK